MTEEWRRVRRNPAYAVSNLGRVRRVFPDGKGRAGGIVPQQIGSHGYPVVRIVPLFGKPKTRLVHRLVCEAFHGPPPFLGAEVAHGDGRRSNPRADNLRWASRIENMADCVLHGTKATGARHGRFTKPERTPRGERHGHAKLTQAAVRAIRAEPLGNGSGRRLAAKFGVSPGTVCMIRGGRTWRHID
jgi:hypothetical protein